MRPVVWPPKPLKAPPSTASISAGAPVAAVNRSPSVSKHLRVLERAGLVRRRVEGRTHHCWLTAAPLAGAENRMAYYRRFRDETLDGLSDHLLRHPD